ncbi:MAG TPA: hypothetical protein VMU68_01515 [Acidimicrobiales bacterium]|nr:hypothetical protein [Acidimicrobiales bacterium]
MIEVTRFRLAREMNTAEFLERNAEYQQAFIYKQKGIVRRTVASGLDGKWIAITWWRSMKDARRSTAEALTSPIAIEFSLLLEPDTIVTEYFKELPG